MTCETCGSEIHIGDWPFCSGDPAEHTPLVHEYHPFKPYWEEHLTPHPVYIESIGQRNTLMKETHSTERPRGQGNPGCWV